MWLKFRHKFAYGPGEWDWVDLGDLPARRGDSTPPEVEDFLSASKAEFDYSEHYRGIEYHEVSSPPSDHLRKVIEEHETSIRNLQSAVKRLRSILEEAQNEQEQSPSK